MKEIKKARTLADVRKHPLVDKGNGTGDPIEMYVEDGVTHYWVNVISGYQVYSNEQHVIHEVSVEQLCRVLNNAKVWADDPELES